MTEDETPPEALAERDNAQQSADERVIRPVIGIGASAGGIDAMKRLFPHVKSDCGMAFVVVQHLDPAYASALTEIIGRASSLPVTEVLDNTVIESNHVYVIPPNSSLRIYQGKLLLTHAARVPGRRDVIDEFFVSLGQDQAENAACIVLSGTGSDGTIGLRAVKENGGLTLAQEGAEYDGMMRSAVATGLVDFVLPVEEIPAKLVEYFAGLNAPDSAKDSPKKTKNFLAQVVEILRIHTGHDFAGYKDRTLIRRVQRRMHVLHSKSMSEFVEQLRTDRREAMLLFQDMLIGVTNFFRDPLAFAALESKVIPELFKGKGVGDTIRVWVPGCATGEEAYSIAMLLRDEATKLQNAPKLQIFATDIDETALETARLGRYPAAVAKDIPAQRLERYFLREDGSYRVASDLREICLFSAHNLLRDPPFSRVDLISCRNLLIYLSTELQNRVIPLFSYALNQGGYLFLGTSENVTGHPQLFLPIDQTQRIFHRRAQLERLVPEFPLTPTDGSRHQPSGRPRRVAGVESTVPALAERHLLESFTPAHVVVNAEGDVLQSSGRTGKYLELPPGAPDTNVFSMARPGLRLDLRAALHKAMTGGQGNVRTRVRLGTNGAWQELALSVQPLRSDASSDTLYMIVFQDIGTDDQPDTEASLVEDDVERSTLRQLESELLATKERLQTTTEELESSNEELKSGNEELQSTNEELQSTNEELQTSKEELQSINEELQTVNSELNARVEELSRANNDMSNLLESTQIATIFLDRTLGVKSFTPAAKELFHLVESDAGRPLMHVRARFDYAGLQEDAERVLRTLSTIERPIRGNESDMRYIMRMLPYRTADNVINGVVLTFADVTRVSAAEAQIAQLTADLRARIAELETLLEIIPVGVMISEGDSSVLVNTYGARLLGDEKPAKGLTPAPASFKLYDGDTELVRGDQPLQRARQTGAAVPAWHGILRSSSGGRTHVMISATPLLGDDGNVRGAIAAIVDMSQHKQAEKHQQLLLAELQHRVKNILATISSLATRMARTAGSVEDFHSSFLSRIAAMARVHDLLVTGAWAGAGLQNLIIAITEPYTSPGAGAVQVSGPAITLPADAAATLGMVFNELATNAAKYGALSAPAGKVDVTWQMRRGTNGERINLTWTEIGGPRVDLTGPAGFGTGFITRSVEYELDGTAVLDMKQTGLECRIEFPVPQRPAWPLGRGDDDASSS
jgi:two-component system CheB/CheR fusion protein